MGASSHEAYFPPPESVGGWRYLTGENAIASIGGMDARKLDRFQESQELLHGGDSWSAVIIRRGYLVKEIHTFNVLHNTRFDIWSGTKSFTGTAWGLLIDDSRCGRLPHGATVDLETPAYDFLPEGHPLTDPRKAEITVRHLLTMTSGLPGEGAGVRGMPTATGAGPFEHALGMCPNRYGRWANKLAALPGTAWDYSDAGMCHLALLFASITGTEMAAFLQQRVLSPIGIENLSWDVQGGSGFMGPHTNAHTGIHVSARELARFGYLMLRDGVWKGSLLVPKWWMDIALRSSQELAPKYGYTWWVNTAGTCWPGLPRDMFALMGYRSNKCYVIPSLDLVVARTGSGPVTWNEPGFIGDIVDAIIDR